MSSGKTHTRASLVLAAGFSLAAMVSLEPKLLECAAGALVGIVCSPDLDLSNGGIVGGKLIRKRVGWFGEKIWKWFWKGYSDSFKHGSFASHFPIFGTFMRLAYVYFWTVLLFYVALSVVLVPPELFNFNIQSELAWWASAFLSPAFFYGLASSDLIHFVLDILTVERVKTMRKHLFEIKHLLIRKG